jgi:hypothetical protein
MLALALFFGVEAAHGQSNEAPGGSIGKVSVRGKLILLELNDRALGTTNLFDLRGRTLRFVPEGPRYRVENSRLRWDKDSGREIAGAQVNLHGFLFPFAGRTWDSFLVGTTGSLRFGLSEKDIKPDAYGHPEGGISLGRFDQLAEVALGLSNSAPAIAVFLKPRLTGPRYVKELSDRVVITWDLTEPYGSYLDFTWFKTVIRFQAVLHSDGTIEMSYDQIAARDAIVGLYPASPGNGTAVHFSSLNFESGPIAAPYEAFHYLAAPRPQDLSCTVIRALGDRFDFLAYYSDFRVDAQEASPPSDGPVGGKVTGIGDTLHDQSPSVLRSRCTEGRFQQGYMGPVFVGSNEAQQGPPRNAPADSNRNIAFYSRQLKQTPPGRTAASYNYAVGHLGHEFGHRWGAYATAKLTGEAVRLGPWPHWAVGLHAPVAFPYSLPTEASTLGGAVWQDNEDGTYTQLREGYFVPAAGYSRLDLYLMGLMSAAEVPDFFVLNNLVPLGQDPDGRPIFKADRTKVTIEDVVAAEGPRSPAAGDSQQRFNTGIVVMVEHGRRPSAKLLKRAEAIRSRWIDYWAITTGHRAAMTTDLQ